MRSLKNICCNHTLRPAMVSWTLNGMMIAASENWQQFEQQLNIFLNLFCFDSCVTGCKLRNATIEKRCIVQTAKNFDSCMLLLQNNLQLLEQN